LPMRLLNLVSWQRSHWPFIIADLSAHFSQRDFKRMPGLN
jgi:hypothetical protein